MTQHEGMEIDIRKHKHVRADVAAGIAALRVQLRQIDAGAQSIDDIAMTLEEAAKVFGDGFEKNEAARCSLGLLLLASVKWIADLGLDPLECLDLALDSYEKIKKQQIESGRPR